MENKNRPDGNGGGRWRQYSSMIVMALVAMAIVFGMKNVMDREQKEEVSYDTFVGQVEAGEVTKVTVNGSQISIEYSEAADKNPMKTYYTNRLEGDGEFVDRLLEHGVTVNRESTEGSLVADIISLLVPFVCIFLFMNFLMRQMGGGMMGIGRSNAKVYMQKSTGVTFADVAGEDEAKESLVELVDFLKNPSKYTGIGARLPKGALLVGPPGTGKTLLAKAVAGEADVPFYFLSGSDFMEMYVGVGASRVRDLFKQAQETSPCIIFIDEIDSIGRSRSGYGGGGESEQQQTLNQLLSEMDGMDSSHGLLILAATNRPEVLDPALLRPGRFDRRIIVNKPDLKGRTEILKVHAKNVSLDDTVDLNAIALATSGAAGSDLANMINEAAILAVKKGRQAVCQKDLFEAVEVVLVGKEKKDRVLSARERRIVSYHEVGHALLSALQKDAEPVQKITIVPRTMGALGYVMQVPEEEKYLNSKEELLAMLVGLLGGRAAEELVFDSVTTGASNDIEKATELARSMVTRYGMSDALGLMALSRQQDMYLSGREVLDCSAEMSAKVDAEVKRLLDTSYEEAKRLLSQNRDVMDKIAEYLIAKETITGREFMDIYRSCRAERTAAAKDGEDEKGAEDAENTEGGGASGEDAAQKTAGVSEA